MKMKNRINQRGSLHLAAVLAVIVMVAIAGIGVKILDRSHADTGVAPSTPSQAKAWFNQLTTITAPTNGASVKGYVPVVAQVGGTTAISKVSFYVNGTEIADAGLAQCYPAPATPPALPARTYSVCWNTKAVPDGRYFLMARATANSGQVLNGLPVYVTVDNGGVTASMTVKIVQPFAGAYVLGYVPVVAYATGPVAKVSFTANDKAIVSAAPESCFPIGTQTLAAGFYETCLDVATATYPVGSSIKLLATATDASGVSVTSPAVTVTVGTPPPPPAAL